MPALSIRQPAAAALVAPPGPFELPGWRTDYRGPLLIHASSRKAGDPPAGRAGSPVYGALIGLVDLTDCVATEHIDEGPDEVGYVCKCSPTPARSPARSPTRGGWGYSSWRKRSSPTRSRPSGGRRPAAADPPTLLDGPGPPAREKKAAKLTFAGGRGRPCRQELTFG